MTSFWMTQGNKQIKARERDTRVNSPILFDAFPKMVMGVPFGLVNTCGLKMNWVSNDPKAMMPIAATVLAQRDLMIVVWRSVPNPNASSHDPVISGRFGCESENFRLVEVILEYKGR